MEFINEKQDLTYLKWSHSRTSSGTAGTFLKSESNLGGVKTYYKLSNYDSMKGIIGHECINEIIVDRLLTILGVEHLDYKLIHADIEIEGKRYETFLCASCNFKKKGESKVALDSYYEQNYLPPESRYDFCIRNGWQKYIDTMIAVDFLILNRDRHGANIEVLRNSRAHTLRIAPLFDHGLSLLCSCNDEKSIRSFDVLEDKQCNNYIGSFSCKENLALINNKNLFGGELKQTDKEFIFEGLSGVISNEHIEKIWEMISERYKYYESI